MPKGLLIGSANFAPSRTLQKHQTSLENNIGKYRAGKLKNSFFI
jgi:hypothetical protein